MATAPAALAQDSSANPDLCANQPKKDNPNGKKRAHCTAASNEGVPPWAEYQKQIKPTERIAPLEQGFAGEKVSLYNGATTFSVTDIDIPGNSDLPVRLVRRLSIALQPQDDIQPYDTRLQGAGNWDVDVPYIAATYPDEKGWNAQRCSNGSVPDLVSGANGRFHRAEVWQGLTIHVPGRGDSAALGLDSSVPVPTSGGPYRLTTSTRDVFSCISMNSGLPGEGFRMTTPDGMSYDFNVAVTRRASKLVKLILANVGQTTIRVYLERTHYYLLASKIEDRYGNTVQYQYNSDGHPTRIWASDGRDIELTYGGQRLQSATSEGHTWNYGYTVATHPQLKNVTLPDGSQWQYAYQGSLKPPTPAPYESLSYPWCQGTPALIDEDFTLTATHPGGVTGTFQFHNTRHRRSGVHASECEQYAQGQRAMYSLLVPYFFDVMSLQNKTLSGPGLPSVTWSYDYSGGIIALHTSVSPGLIGLWGQHDEQPNYPCTTCVPYKTVKVTRPDGSQKLDRYGIVYRLDDGRLLQTQIRTANNQVARTTQYTYLAEGDVAAQPFYGQYGHVYGGVGDPTTPRIRPVTQTKLTQDGTTFTTQDNTFDTYARVTEKTESNSAASRNIKTAYYDDTMLWVLGQAHKTTIDGVVASKTTYDSATAEPLDSYRFGRFAWARAWNTDGTLQSLTDGNNHAMTFTQWKRGKPQHVQFADGTTASAVVNGSGWVTSMTDENHHTTGYQHDTMGRLTRITPPSDNGQNWQNTELTFAPATQSEFGIPAGHWTQVVHTGPNKAVTYYDGLWRPLVTEHFDSTNKTATLSQVATRYDPMGRTVFKSYVTNTISNAASANVGTHSQYDALGRVKNVQQNSELGLLTTTMGYPSGNKVQVTDPKNHITTTTYQAYGEPSNNKPGNSKPVEVVFAQGTTLQTTTTVARDVFGSPTQMAQTGTWQGLPIAVTHSFGYNTHHQLCRQSSPETGITGYGYDAAANLKWTAQGVSGNPCALAYTPPLSAKITRSYDARDRLTAINYPSGTADSSFSYYDDGKVHTATRGDSTWTSTYLNRGMLKSETLSIDGHSFGLGYLYDNAGHRRQITYPSNRQISLLPDGRGRPSQLGVYANDVRYVANGKLGEMTYGNDIEFRATFNTRQLPRTMRYRLHSDYLTYRVLDYDKNANPESILEDGIFDGGFLRYALQGAQLSSGTDNRTYGYDALDRLTSVNSDLYGTAGYVYDALGNIRQRNSSTGGNISYQYSNNRIDTASGSPYHYDDRGNVQAIGSFALTRNRANELVTDGFNTHYAYDARSWRVKKQVQAATSGDGTQHTIYYVYDRQHRLMERLDNSTVTDFVYLGTKAIARIKGNTTTYIHGDYQNTPLFETNDAGLVTRAPKMLPYAQSDPSGVAEIPGYTGAAPDSETGLLYLGARYLYGQRFLSPDPVGLDPTSPMGLNRYAYANDNPVRFTDPDGRESVGEMIDNAAEGCGAVSCAGWAAANALWSVFGAEGVSQVYDKGAGASTGNMVMAGVEVATLGQGGKVGAGIRAVKGTARWFSPAAQVSRRIGKEFGVIGSATKNARGKVFKVAEGKVTVRAMESGGGRTNYLRISVEGKGSVDAAGAFSSDRAATHIPINDDSIKLIQDVIKRYTK